MLEVVKKHGIVFMSIYSEENKKYKLVEFKQGGYCTLKD